MLCWKLNQLRGAISADLFLILTAVTHSYELKIVYLTVNRISRFVVAIDLIG